MHEQSSKAALREAVNVAKSEPARTWNSREVRAALANLVGLLDSGLTEEDWEGKRE